MSIRGRHHDADPTRDWRISRGTIVRAIEKLFKRSGTKKTQRTNDKRTNGRDRLDLQTQVESRHQPDQLVGRQHPDHLGVLVLKDMGDYPRACFWPEVLGCLKTKKPLEVRVRTLMAPDMFFIAELQHYDVLIVNWDAINGDPSFGADFAMRWCEHRLPEIRLWIADGGLLVIEGQAKLSVPVQAAYDALVGPGQLRVSGPSDPSQSGIEEVRVGKRCALTRRAGRLSQLRKLGDEHLSSEKRNRCYKDMFPGCAGRLISSLRLRDLLLTPDQSEREWNYLYRGWFLPWIPRTVSGRRLEWVGLVQTADRRRHELPQPTVMAAKYGDGAIFATTMLLSNLNNEDRGFITAILNYHGNTHELPEPTSAWAWRFMKSHAREVIALFVAAILGFLYRNTIPDFLMPFVVTILALLVLGAILLILYIASTSTRIFKEMMGL
jgi:hypothetical protein